MLLTLSDDTVYDLLLELMHSIPYLHDEWKAQACVASRPLVFPNQPTYLSFTIP